MGQWRDYIMNDLKYYTKEEKVYLNGTDEFQTWVWK